MAGLTFKVQKLFQKTLFGVFSLFGLIVLSTSVLCIYTVDTHLSSEYENNSRNIAQTIADSSVDILLNRGLSSLQSLIDQFVELQGIRYIYITSEDGEFLAHTFVPGIPDEILASDPSSTETVERSLPGLGDFVEVGSPILAGEAGHVHVGMDTDLVALKIQRAIGQQVYLISIILVVGVLASIWFVNLAAKPLGDLMAYAVHLARHPERARSSDARSAGSRPGAAAPGEEILERDDEVGQLARLFLHFAGGETQGGRGSASGGAS